MNNDEQDIGCELEQSFIKEVNHFLASELPFHRASKAVEDCLRQLNERGSNAKSDVLDKPRLQLARLSEQQREIQKKQCLLNSLCQFARFDTLRDSFGLQAHTQILQSAARVQEDSFLNSLMELKKTVEDSAVLSEAAQEHSLIKEVMREAKSLYTQALSKLSGQLLTPTLLKQVLVKCPSLIQETEMKEAVTKQRLQHLRLTLNPIFNSFNYAQNIAQVYTLVFNTWASHLQQEAAQLHFLALTVSRLFLTEIQPKMEKSINRLLDILQLAKIRRQIILFINKVITLNIEGSHKEKQDIIEGLMKMLNQCQELLQARIEEQADQMVENKYNVYSLASYVSIRKHLEQVRECAATEVGELLGLKHKKVEWAKGFHRLAQSRKCEMGCKNKSLLVFNLNIWYLFAQVVESSAESEETLVRCTKDLASVNIMETVAKYPATFQKMISISADVSALRNCLFTGLQLLGHEALRRKAQQELTQAFVTHYENALTGKQPMNNEEVKQYCLQHKLSLQQFGKESSTVCIYSSQQLTSLLLQSW